MFYFPLLLYLLCKGIEPYSFNWTNCLIPWECLGCLSFVNLLMCWSTWFAFMLSNSESSWDSSYKCSLGVVHTPNLILSVNLVCFFDRSSRLHLLVCFSNLLPILIPKGCFSKSGSSFGRNKNCLGTSFDSSISVAKLIQLYLSLFG